MSLIKSKRFVVRKSLVGQNQTINSLNSNNIKYKIKTDDWNLDYILINK